MNAAGSGAESFNLLRWFSISSLVAIALSAALTGYLLSRFLSQHLLERDARVSMEFVQSVAKINEPESYFRGSKAPQDRAQLEQFFHFITEMPDVLRANVYSKNQTVIWSSDPDLVGKRFGDNDELRDALKGRLRFKHEHRGEHGKIEHAYLPDEVTDFLESYVPIWDRSRSDVVGVVEIYKAPRALFQALRQGSLLVAAVTALSALGLYGILFWIVRRGAGVIAQQQRALVEAEKLTVIGELTSSVTHNLRNPLAAIRSSAELGLAEIDGELRENIEDIIEEVDRLDQWVRELLVVTHDNGTSPVASLRQVVEAALAHFGQRPEKQRVQVSAELTPELPAVRCNPEALTQVLITLIANALEAMPAGGTLILRTVQVGKGRMGLQVVDTGHGIAQPKQSDVLKPLVSLKPGGLGIGLPLARRILQRYGGSLALSSRAGEGTEVSLQLPVTG